MSFSRQPGDLCKHFLALLRRLCDAKKPFEAVQLYLKTMLIFHNLWLAKKSGFYFFQRAERNLLARGVRRQKELNA